MITAPYRYRRLTCRMFANPSGVSELDPNLTINGTTVEPTFRYKGGDADGTDFASWGDEVNLVADHDMEAAGVVNWPEINDATITKQGGAYEGSQCLRITCGAMNNPYTKQTVATVGEAYRIKGVARSDGNGGSVPRLRDNGGGDIWTGTDAHANWQTFDVIHTALGTEIRPYTNLTIEGNYVEFDNITIKNSHGETLTLQAGAVPTYNDGSPGLGSNDDSVKFNGGGYYKAGGNAFADITTEDVVFETVFKMSTGTLFLYGKRTAVGPAVFINAGSLYFKIIDVGGNVSVVSVALTEGVWYHVMFFLDRSGSGQCYIDGVASGAAVDISAISGSLTSAIPFVIGANEAGAANYDSNIAYAAQWHGAAWLDTHLQATVAAERFALFNGCGQANKANGTALASVKTRAFNAYLRKQDGANVKLYNVGSEWMRMESLDDSNGVNVKGYLAEPQIENLIIRSEDFAQWTPVDIGDTITNNVVECPDGRTAMSSLVADATDGQHGVELAATLTAVTHAYSGYAKPGNKDWIHVVNSTVANCDCYFDVTNGTIGTAGAGAVGYLEGPFKGGSYRWCIVFAGTAAAHTLQALSAHADGDDTFAGDGVTVNTYLWGAQCEKNDYMSSPILTDGATATRLKDQDRSVGDDGNIANNGRGFMRFNVLAADCDRAADTALVTLSDGGAAADMIAVTLAAAGDAATVTTAATAGNAGSATVAVDIADGESHEIRVRWETDYLNIAVDGVWGTADTSVDIPDDLDRVDYGQDRSAASQAQCIVSNLRIHSAVRGG